jgi:hypothetical protein
MRSEIFIGPFLDPVLARAMQASLQDPIQRYALAAPNSRDG